MDNYQILLFYYYTKLEDPEQFREEHHLFCVEHDLRGRIIVASEGLNGTVSGTLQACQDYMGHLKSDPRFGSIDFKVDTHEGHAFQKLNIRVKPEIVNLGKPKLNPNKKTGKYVEPEEFLEVKNDPDVVLLDVRSKYEHSIGKFKNAVTLDIENFRDFPEEIKNLEELKSKKVLTYCTGGIKCEKASAFLLEQGFENVYQLHGGIIKYGLQEGGEDFEGKCYVFDNRLAVEVNTVNPTLLGHCHICQKPCDRMVNCANPDCNKHVPICEDCAEEMEGACSEECKTHEHKRAYNGTGYYGKELNGYNPRKGLFRQKAKR